MTETSRRGFLGGMLGVLALSAGGATLVIPQPPQPETVGNTGWILCNGQSLQAAEFPELNALLDGAYGKSPGVFNVPNAFSRVVKNPTGIVYAINPRSYQTPEGYQMLAGNIREFYLAA